MRLEQPQRLGAVAGQQHGEAVGPQRAGGEVAQARLVLDQQDRLVAVARRDARVGSAAPAAPARWPAGRPTNVVPRAELALAPRCGRRSAPRCRGRPPTPGRCPCPTPFEVKKGSKIARHDLGRHADAGVGDPQADAPAAPRLAPVGRRGCADPTLSGGNRERAARGIASRALTERFISTCPRWPGSTGDRARRPDRARRRADVLADEPAQHALGVAHHER